MKIQLHITLKILTHLIKIETRIIRKISEFGELEMCIVIKASLFEVWLLYIAGSVSAFGKVNQACACMLSRSVIYDAL